MKTWDKADIKDFLQSRGSDNRFGVCARYITVKVLHKILRTDSARKQREIIYCTLSEKLGSDNHRQRLAQQIWEMITQLKKYDSPISRRFTLVDSEMSRQKDEWRTPLPDDVLLYILQWAYFEREVGDLLHNSTACKPGQEKLPEKLLTILRENRDKFPLEERKDELKRVQKDIRGYLETFLTYHPICTLRDVRDSLNTWFTSNKHNYIHFRNYLEAIGPLCKYDFIQQIFPKFISEVQNDIDIIDASGLELMSEFLNYGLACRWNITRKGFMEHLSRVKMVEDPERAYHAMIGDDDTLRITRNQRHHGFNRCKRPNLKFTHSLPDVPKWNF